jgi:periplasmic protein TonB
MQSTGKGNPGPEQARSDLALGRCLVEGDPDATSPARRSRRRAFGLSLAIETSLLMLFVAAPLLTSVAQPQLHQNPPSQLTFFGVWRAHNPAQHAATPTTAPRPAIQNPFPPTAPPITTMDIDRVEVTGDASIPELPEGYVPGAIQITEGKRMPPPAELPHSAPPAQQEKHPVKVSEGVLEAQLVSRTEPRYPTIAVLTKTEGTVRLHAIISREGRITSLDVISGHPLLVKAALDAVQLWRYRPTMLNGEPVEVETSITVIFRLHE